MNFNWASEFPDLQKLCIRFNYYELLYPKKFFYKPLISIIQDGPQCGLVALTICSREPHKDTVEKIFEDAKNRNFTFNGEMFSANDMVILAKSYLETKVELYNGILNSEIIVNFILSGGILLVPYDADKNHSPCNLNGHKAHWAVISGLIETEDCIYVLAKHGKSLNINIWKLDTLSESNSQLTEFSPDRRLSNCNYKLPIGGLAGNLGLRNKSVLIYPR